MDVSIIIPAYNAAQTISDTLESVLAQTFANWEAVVVDDGSGDRTADIVRGFIERDARIRMISQPNGGESAARNSGIAEARYEWLLFLDADDWISPLHLERMTGRLMSDPGLGAVHCGSVRVALDGTQVSDNYEPPEGDMFPTLARRAAFPVHACIVRRSLVEAVGKLDTSLKKSPDWDLWQRIARTGARFGAVREVLAYYRIQPNSSSLDAEQLFYDGLRVLRQGHAPDPRVPNPHPDYAGGWKQDKVESQQFYLLCWCAGLMLGYGKDARSLFEAVKDDHYDGLYPNAIAQCIFEAATLPSGQPPRAWERLWPKIEHLVKSFLAALEEQSRTADLARRALIELKKMILKHSPAWSTVIEDYERALAERQELIEQLKDRDEWKRLAEERVLLIRDLQEES
ncbi:MAG TPA: glycosyltransferase [Blastocatellia bacterium]|nr:glycosyltransferase [Blastocatellia bacterium]